MRHKQARTEAERLRREHEASLMALAEEKTQTHSLVSSLRDAVLVVNRARRRRARQPGHDRPSGDDRRPGAAPPGGRASGAGPPGSPGGTADGSCQGPHHRPAGHRRADVHDQHRDLPRRRRRRPGAHPHPVRHLPDPPAGHGEGTLHPHHGARTQVAPRRRPQPRRGGHRQEPGRRPRRLSAHAHPCAGAYRRHGPAHQRPPVALAERAGQDDRGARASGRGTRGEAG